MAEVLITEHMTQEQLDAYYRRTYHGPSARVAATGKPEERPDPAGFDVESQRDSFAAFAKAVGGLE
ncbi:hypothetical protein [Nocardia sp. NPDC005745]|uniref:hypothetical protein n=1 Tax=Nocardia sp. NPDC005745 TaxID=3157061 RepID=UPI0033C081FF